MKPIAFIVLVFFVCLVAFIVLFKSFFSDRKERKNSANHDALFENFYYLLETNQITAEDKLSVKNISDSVEYCYDSESSVLSIGEDGSCIEFKLLFFEIQGYVYMVAKLKSPIEKRSHIPALLNKFFEKKINATIVEGFYFEALVKNYNLNI